MLSAELKKRIRVAITDESTADELIAAIQASVASPASDVAAIGSTSNIPVSNVTLSTANTYSDAAVKTAIDAAANAIRVAAEARLDVIEAKVDEILSAIKTAGLMS